MPLRVRTRAPWACAIGLLALAASAEADTPSATDDGSAIWLQPLATAMAFDGPIVVPVGMNAALRPGVDLVIEATPMLGPWYGCGTTTSGGWLSIGVGLNRQLPVSHWRPAFYRRGLEVRAFVVPKLEGRYFDTQAGAPRCSPPPDGVGRDGELGLGLDVGVEIRVAHIYAGLVIGANATECIDCYATTMPFSGFQQPPFQVPAGDHRANRFEISANLNLLRLGFAF